MLDYVKAKQKAARELTCVSCGEPFIALRSDVKYCKNACRLTAQRKHKAELRPAKHAHTCAECGKTIVSQRSTKKYCSDDCKNAWWSHSRLTPKKRRACTCGNIRRCSECRRRAQAKDTPTASLSPDVLAICLEVKALNSRKHQTAARLGAGD
jgi:hypothetical protein